MKRVLALSLVLMIVTSCSDSMNPTEERRNPDRPPLLSSSNQKILFPNEDVTTGWFKRPSTEPTHYGTLSEGVDSTDYDNWVDACLLTQNLRLGFTDLGLTGKEHIRSLAFRMQLTECLEMFSPGACDPLSPVSVQLNLAYFIDDTSVDAASLFHGYVGEVPNCLDTLWVVTFDDLCLTSDELATLEVELSVSGGFFCDGNTGAIVYAMDVAADYDDPIGISNVSASFDEFECEYTVTWDTDVASSTTVKYGTCSNLNLTATGTGNTTSHSVTIDATNRTKLYYKVVSAAECGEEESGCLVKAGGNCLSGP